jgi:hypothetical protein
MLFKSKHFSSTWDTWMYYDSGTYYLYYLITETSGGEGFGVATSEDGIHWNDRGMVLQASDQMVIFLGTGAVWRKPDEEQRIFICNYSEWHVENGKNAQRILFAWSEDLIHWTKYGEENTFEVNESLYKKYQEDGGRWDCIYPIPRKDGGYYGYWTASPLGYKGFGFGETTDGLNWTALDAPRIEWDAVEEMTVIEAGAVHQFGSMYYAMLGNYLDPSGMYTFVADQPEGPFRPARKNHALLHNESFMHVYFARFLVTPDEILLNHHSLLRETNGYDRPITYFAPLKKASVNSKGILYLYWWEGNEKLKGSVIDENSLDAGRFTEDRGIIMEGTVELPGSLQLEMMNGCYTVCKLDPRGVMEFGYNSNKSGFNIEERVDRQMHFGKTCDFRLLMHPKGLIEWYLNDILMQCYTLISAPNGKFLSNNLTDIRIWEWNVQS